MDPFVDLLNETCCPHCWKNFPVDETLWVSVSPDLVGDALLGPTQMRRFLPSRFTLEGNALDASGSECRELACPHCHLSVPRAILEMEPLYVSIVGSPGCGKSYFLTALTWQLRHFLPQFFELEFRDADLVANRTLTSYEESLFLRDQPQQPVLLADLIRKTEEQGDQYDVVRYGEQRVMYPRPFLFSVQPMRDHLLSRSPRRLARTLCVYDNAGESFAAGRDLPGNPVTQHLARCHILIFLFDPTQDPRFRGWLEGDPASTGRPNAYGRQDTFLNETINRIRRLTGLAQTQRTKKPLLVVVTKSDTWSRRVPVDFNSDPWREKQGKFGLDIALIQQRSEELRKLLKQVTPEVVGAADGISEQVIYLPVSALGVTPTRDPQTGKATIRPADIRPVGITVPLLYGLFLSAKSLMQVIMPKKKH